MLFESDDFYNTLNTFGINMSDLIGIQNKDSNFRPHLSGGNSKFLSPAEGFQRGNLYRNEYKPYKNMTYIPVHPKNEKEQKLFKVFELDFAITDLSFHLDLNPEDKEAFALFKIYAKELEIAKKEYENLYGPLCVEDTDGQVYDWVDNPWPWDKDKGDMYV